MIVKFTMFFTVFVLALNLSGQSVYKNGYLSTGSVSKSGVAAPTGFAWSEVQNDAGVTTVSNALAGLAGHTTTSGTTAFSIADDFTVPAGQVWNVVGINVYGYQSNAVVAPIDQLYLRIWNGPPDNPLSTVIFGDSTTNRLSTTIDSLSFRIFNSLYPTASMPSTTRKIWRFSGSASTTLQTGTYWVEWRVHAINNSSVFFPTATVVNSRGVLGWNAKQYNHAAKLWTNILDNGSPDTVLHVPQDMPFEISYYNVTPNPARFLKFTGEAGVYGNQLNWKVAEERNVRTYDIERSTDGIIFKHIANISAKNQIGENSYQLLDKSIEDNTEYYYHLRTIDQDGTTTLSGTILIRNKKVKDDLWITNSSGMTILNIRSTKNAAINVRIVNEVGQITATKMYKINKGLNSLDLPAESTRKGIYYVSVFFEGKMTLQTKFVR